MVDTIVGKSNKRKLKGPGVKPSRRKKSETKTGSEYKSKPDKRRKKAKVAVRTSTQKNKGSNFTLQTLIGVINEALPQTVEKNMRAPRLEKRTGRFANSTRITDIVRTREGFPSIGYTYQKNPYQTFEVGYRQGDAERDPRKLIDASVREIASKFAIGRFYTRRV